MESAYFLIPPEGKPITAHDGKLDVPDIPIIPFIEGDGIGPDIWQATRPVLDEATRLAYDGSRRLGWMEIPAGEKAIAQTGNPLPEATIQAIANYRVAIKGPLTTPVGQGFRSLNVALRRRLDLYACIRPVRWIPGVPTPVRNPEWVDMVIFRENTGQHNYEENSQQNFFFQFCTRFYNNIFFTKYSEQMYRLYRFD